MTWVRLDDQFPIHRKVSVLSDAAYRLHTEGICWSARNGTDGMIGRDELPTIGARAKGRLIAELIRRDVWHATGHGCERCAQPIDGWVIHDYLTYQPTREQVEVERKAKAERQQRWMDKARRVRGASTGASRDASQVASRDTPRDASRDGSKDASRDGPEDITPLPPRPEGKRGGSPVAPPAAFGDGAPAGGGSKTLCRNCGNDPSSAYHRKVCRVGRSAS